MADDSWYGQLAKWIISGAFWAGIAFGSIGAVGCLAIYAYKQRVQEQEDLKELEKQIKAVSRIKHLESGCDKSRTQEHNPEKDNALVEVKVVQEPVELTQQSMTTGRVESSVRVLETTDDDEATKNQEVAPAEESQSPLDDSKTMRELDEVFEPPEETKKEQEVQPEDTNSAEGLGSDKETSQLVKELAEAAEDCVTSTSQTTPVDSVFKF